MALLSEDLTEYALRAQMSPAVRERARLSVADAMVAILSARTLPAGIACARYVGANLHAVWPVVHEFATFTKTSVEHAAFVNGTMAHGDETDDSHEIARMHPGASIVPTAMAVAEETSATMAQLLDSVAVGYDIGAALNLGTWNDRPSMRRSLISTHHIGGLFGSLGVQLRLRSPSLELARRAFSYAVQHAGGCMTCFQDTEHIEKGVTFGGLPARSALFSYELASLGFSAVADPFSGPESFFNAFGVQSDAGVTRARLKSPGLALTETSIKRYPVGMPIQAACEAVERIVGYGERSSPNSVRVELPQERYTVVDSRKMADISLDHVLALQLATGRVDFAMLHELTEVPASVAELKRRVTLVGSRDLDVDRNGTGTTLVARVTLNWDQREVTETVSWPIGTPRNPIQWDGMERKAREVLGSCGWNLDDVVELIGLLRATALDSPVPALVDRLVALAGRNGVVTSVR